MNGMGSNPFGPMDSVVYCDSVLIGVFFVLAAVMAILHWYRHRCPRDEEACLIDI